MQKPKPVFYAEIEGGVWQPWSPPLFRNQKQSVLIAKSVRIAAIRFDDDTIFDLITGEWRMYEDPERLQRQGLVNAFEEELLERHCMSKTDRVDCPYGAIERALHAVLEKYEVRKK